MSTRYRSRGLSPGLTSCNSCRQTVIHTGCSRRRCWGTLSWSLSHSRFFTHVILHWPHGVSLSSRTWQIRNQRHEKGFRTLPNAQVLKSTFKHRSKSLTLSLHRFLLSYLSLPILSDKLLLCQAYEFKDWLLCPSFLMSLWPFTQSIMSDCSILVCSEGRLCITEV